MSVQRGYLAALQHTVSELDTTGVTLLPSEQISPNALNFYEVADVDALLDAILLDGLQSPLVVRAGGAGAFVLISGHRRFAALQKLWREGLVVAEGKLFAKELAAGLVPVLVNTYQDDWQAELALIRANSDTRVLSSAELAKQAERVELLLYQMKHAGYDFPGRMREHVADICQVSASKLARLKVIREGLLADFQVLFQAGKLRESAAYALARLTLAQQEQLHRYFAEKKRLSSITEQEVSRFGKALAALEQTRCKMTQGLACENREGRLCSYFQNPWSQSACPSGCCASCERLSRCKFACKKLSERVKTLRRDAKAQRAQAHLTRETKEAPDLLTIRSIWARFAAARQAAGCSVEEIFKLMDRYYYESLEANFCASERGEGTIKLDTALPFGSGLRLSEVKKLCAAADRFGCSVDFLLGRGDASRDNSPPMLCIPEAFSLVNAAEKG